jgi:predicted PurR-regulated permease PerM
VRALKKTSGKSKGVYKNDTSSSKGGFYFLLFAYILAIVALAILFRPFIYAIVLGATLGVFFFPVNNFLKRKGLGPNLSASLLVIFIVLVVFFASFFFINSVVTQVTAAYRTAAEYEFSDLDGFLESTFGLEVSTEEIVLPIVASIRDAFTVSIPDIINSLTSIFIGLLIMLFLLFYIFKEGANIWASIMATLPLSDDHKTQIKDESEKVLKGVMYGHILMAFVQGFLGGFAFFIFGLPNPIFWGLIMTILALIPLVGTPIVWIPAGIIQLVQGNLFSGIGVLAFGAIIILYMENIFKPKFLGKQAGMHPVLMVMAIFGGLQLFGILGIIMGPILVARCVLIIKLFNQNVLIKKRVS